MWKAFGADSKIFFGSRADDFRQGGDINLQVESGKVGHVTVFEAQLRFLARVKLALEEQKIDVRVDSPDRTCGPEILRIARVQGVTL